MSGLGLTVIEHQNADLYGEGQWTGTPETADGSQAPLPSYPQKSDMPLANEPLAFVLGLVLGVPFGIWLWSVL